MSHPGIAEVASRRSHRGNYFRDFPSAQNHVTLRFGNGCLYLTCMLANLLLKTMNLYNRPLMAFLLALIFLASVGNCSKQITRDSTPRIFPDSNITPQLLTAIQIQLNQQVYPNCSTSEIRALALINLTPITMAKKQSFKSGDTWVEQILFNACGQKAAHKIQLTFTAEGAVVLKLL